MAVGPHADPKIGHKILRHRDETLREHRSTIYMMLLIVLTLAASIIEQSAERSPCDELNDVYVDANRLIAEGRDALTLVDSLLDLSKACAQGDSERRHGALEGYALAFEIATKDGAAPSPEICQALESARPLGHEISAEQPSNRRIATLAELIDRWADSERCDDSENSTPTVTPPPKKLLPREDLSIPIPINNTSSIIPLRNGAIIMGALSGISLVSGVLFTSIAAREARLVEKKLDSDQPAEIQATNNVCNFGNAAADYCSTLQRFKVAAIVSWSLSGIATVSSVVLGVAWSRRSRSESRRIEPRVSAHQQGFVVGANLRF